MTGIAKLLLGATALALALVTFGAASLAADVENGERLARRWCVTCHVVAADQVKANADVPPFAVVARRPGFTTADVASFLLSPHPKMPDFPLSRREAEDIAGYIATLAK